jgi:hypothetical protein
MGDYISVFLILCFFMDEYEEEDSGAIMPCADRPQGKFTDYQKGYSK